MLPGIVFFIVLVVCAVLGAWMFPEWRQRWVPRPAWGGWFPRAQPGAPRPWWWWALLVAGLTYTAFTSKSDFSFLGGILTVGGFVALGTIVAAVIFGFKLGIWFSGIMILFAGGCVLYDTARIIHDYPDG